MPVYTVHVPEHGATSQSAADAATFVREGFSWSALVFGPLWLLAHRLWLAFACWLVLTILIGAVPLLGFTRETSVALAVVLALLLGLEGRSLIRRKLSRGAWRIAGVVVADTRDDAERKFFAGWGDTSDASSAPVAAARRYQPAQPTGMVGVFPGGEDGR